VGANDRGIDALFAWLRALLIGGAVLVGVLVPAAPLAEPAAPSWGAPVFVAHVPLDGAGFASQIAIADFNGDGHEDVLITRNSQNAQHTFPVTVLLGDGAGHFTNGTSAAPTSASHATTEPGTA
jgi:FG-GAP-like repeat